MPNENQDYFKTYYETWANQSKDFFNSANHYLTDLFSGQNYKKPEDYLSNIQGWADHMKTQWAHFYPTEEQKMFSGFLKNMNQVHHDAIDRMIDEWMLKAKQNDPIKNTRDLYELWLNCCDEIYKKSIQSKTYQKSYHDMIQNMFEYWKTYTP